MKWEKSKFGLWQQKHICGGLLPVTIEKISNTDRYLCSIGGVRNNLSSEFFTLAEAEVWAEATVKYLLSQSLIELKYNNNVWIYCIAVYVAIAITWLIKFN